MFISITDTEFCESVLEIIKTKSLSHPEIKKFLEDHFRRSFSSISKRYRRCRRESIFAAYDKIRAEKAKKLLAKECCYQAQYDLGFKNESYFSRWFRKHTGVNPDMYRRKSV
ncbi:MAG TPA: helix-turn-helix domain-containing protein [Clostridiales bacterium]|nr:helix-turn-helix domain-containing protein [Clostridiales bacterium]